MTIVVDSLLILLEIKGRASRPVTTRGADWLPSVKGMPMFHKWNSCATPGRVIAWPRVWTLPVELMGRGEVRT